MTKEYIAPGLMEMHLQVGPPAARVAVDFTGGSASGYGNVPARFVTSDPVLQGLIEKSRAFRMGVITINRRQR